MFSESEIEQSRVVILMLGERVGSHFLESREIEDKELFAMTRDELIFFKAAENSARRFFGQPCHIGQVLVGQANGNTDALAFLNAGTLGQVHEDGSHA